jgi:hypothetical protein
VYRDLRDVGALMIFEDLLNILSTESSNTVTYFLTPQSHVVCFTCSAMTKWRTSLLSGYVRVMHSENLFNKNAETRAESRCAIEPRDPKGCTDSCT